MVYLIYIALFMPSLIIAAKSDCKNIISIISIYLEVVKLAIAGNVSAEFFFYTTPA
jgi:hypothetical protein